eukprot:jgi/Galph1/1499/GphlegSOOS_G183.1
MGPSHRYRNKVIAPKLPLPLREQLSFDNAHATSTSWKNGMAAVLKRKQQRRQRKLVKTGKQNTRAVQQKKKALRPHETKKKQFKIPQAKALLGANGSYEESETKNVHKETMQANRSAGNQQGMEEVLARKMRSLWNRLSENNALYVAKSFQDCLCKVSDEAMRSQSYSLLASLLLEALNSHTSLVSSVHPHISSFAAVICFFHYHMKTWQISIRLIYELLLQILHVTEHLEDIESEDASKDNDILSLLMLLLELYKFEVVHCQIIYELIRYFASHLTEWTAQCLLFIIRRCGAELRKDDPTALKDIVEFIHNCSERQNEENHSKVFTTRFQILLELIYDWKDNKLSKMSERNNSFAWIDQIIQNSKASKCLRFSLKDVQSMDWNRFYSWITNRNNETAEMKLMERNDGEDDATKDNNNIETPFEDKIIDRVLSSQRLNTDTRRNIFAMIITSQDVVDARQRIIQYVGNKRRIMREVCNLILLACCQERHFNYFYVALVKELCVFSKNYWVAFQFCLWEHWKRIQEGEIWSKRRLSVFSTFISHLLLERIIEMPSFRVLPEYSQWTSIMKDMMEHILSQCLHDAEDTFLSLLNEGSKDSRCKSLYLSLYFILQEWQQDLLHSQHDNRVNGWLSVLKRRNEVWQGNESE